jgi:lipopolysaccharide transport system permease protein
MINDNDNFPITVIDPVRSWGFPDFVELFHYRDLIYFLIWRGIKVTYAQSVVGFAWALVQPAIQIFIFSIVFGSLLQLDTGGVPYPLFSTVAVIPWSYMATSMSVGSSSLVSNTGMLGKVYFPRLIYLLSPSIGGLLPFFISFILVAAVLAFYQQPLSGQLYILPLVFCLMIAVPFSIALWLASLTIRFRDFTIIMGQLMRAIIYFVPVMYPSSEISAEWRSVYIMNPFVGVIEGYRSSLLGEPIYWDSLIWSASVTSVLLVFGALYFRRMERIVVDVI